MSRLKGYSLRHRQYGESLANGLNHRKRVDFSLASAPPKNYFLYCINFLSADERLQGAQSISLIRTDLSKPNPKTGAVQLEWNKTGTLLLVRFGKVISPNRSRMCCLPGFSPQKTYQPLCTSTPFHLPPNHLPPSSAAFCCITSLCYTRGGIRCVRVAWQCAAGPGAFIHGATSGLMRGARRWRWQSVSACLRVSIFQNGISGD